MAKTRRCHNPNACYKIVKKQATKIKSINCKFRSLIEPVSQPKTNKIRIRRIWVEEVIAAQGGEFGEFPFNTVLENGQHICGIASIPIGNNRMKLFLRNPSCACCGCVGKYFWLLASPRFGKFSLSSLYVPRRGGETILTLVHIKPKSKGGTLAPNNIQVLCSSCNNFKGDEEIGITELQQRRNHVYRSLMGQLKSSVAL